MLHGRDFAFANVTLHNCTYVKNASYFLLNIKLVIKTPQKKFPVCIWSSSTCVLYFI